MNIAYVVTSGSYSDYGVDAVFSTKAKAQLYIDIHGGCEYSIEEFNLDPEVYQPSPGMLPYEVHMLKDGNLCKRWDMETRQFEPMVKNVYASGPLGPEHDKWTESYEDAYEFYMWADSPEHAIKIANERRVQRIANGEWKSKS